MNKEEAIKDLVNSFFIEFTKETIIKEVGKMPEQLEPKILKQIMLEHYEDIANAFHQSVYPQIAAINGIKTNDTTKEITPDMMKSVCMSETLFNTMVDTYRKNFIALLQGRMP
ncbi:hypothetical protein [Prevotella koreensis]|uniref:Uncharacterized protein n=1 Tax=Prevotella koreensis TaxID=2490854 RepID=A0A3S0QT77_9BACT|nr:hypothetical protein [Prevotella koreensis]RUL58911.1 hypothetical protein EHV08_03420 [Prevotella koreensis]